MCMKINAFVYLQYNFRDIIAKTTWNRMVT